MTSDDDLTPAMYRDWLLRERIIGILRSCAWVMDADLMRARWDGETGADVCRVRDALLAQRVIRRRQAEWEHPAAPGAIYPVVVYELVSAGDGIRLVK